MKRRGGRPRRKDQSSFDCHRFFVLLFLLLLLLRPSVGRREEERRKFSHFWSLKGKEGRKSGKAGKGDKREMCPLKARKKKRQRGFFPLRPGLAEVEGVSESGEGEKAAERRTRGASSSSSSRSPKKGEWRASLPPSPVENRQSRPRPPSGERVRERVRAD